MTSDELNRGARLTRAILPRLEEEMSRKRLSGSWIIRDALEKRYGIEIEGEPDLLPGDSTDLTPAEKGTTFRVVTPEKAMDTTQPNEYTVATTPTGVAAAITTSSNTTAQTVTTMPIGIARTLRGIAPTLAAPSSPTSGASGHGPTGAVLDHLDEQTLMRPVRFRAGPSPDRKITRFLARARHQRELLNHALHDARQELDRAAAEVVRLRTAVADLETRLEARETEHHVRLHRLPRLVRGTAGEAFVVVRATDDSGNRITVTQRIRGCRVK